MKNSNSKLSSTDLAQFIYSFFGRIKDHRSPNAQIELADVLMSAYSMFSLKFSSLLKFENEMKKKDRSTNMKRIFNVKKVPSDTQMRSIIDEVSPDHLRNIFKGLFKRIQAQKKLGAYQYLRRNNSPAYYVAVDGTEHFSSTAVHGDCCLSRKKKEETLHYHQMLAAAIISPELKTVIPLAPEAIVKQDGNTKNDCEFNAFKRWAIKFREDHPKLNVVLGGDALFTCGKMIKFLKRLDMGFILAAKPKSHKGLFNYIEGSRERGDLKYHVEKLIIGDKVKKEVTKEYYFKNGVPVDNKSSCEFSVNFLKYKETISWTNKKGVKKKEQRLFCWVTDIKLNKMNIEKVTRGGRSRWSIENEVFNTLKNQGYHFEHNYGHGNKHLTTNFSLIMMLAFFVDQILEMSCPTFKKVLLLFKKKSYIWERLRGYYQDFVLNSWEHLWSIFIKASEGLMLIDST